MNATVRIAAFLSFALALSGCTSEYADVSGTQPYRQAVGEVCTVQAPLNAFGVALKIETNKKTDHIAITSLNLSGPEFTLSTKLPPLTTLEVVGVRVCTNCPFEKRTEYQVRVQPMPEVFGSAPVYIDLKRIELRAMQCKTLRGSLGAA
jgi:hypothetical protein